jgi:fatty-acyl-CoA synthase
MPALSYVELFLRRRDERRPLITDDEATLTYADCVEQGDRLARALAAQGLTRPARVAVMLPNGPAFVIALYACARIGVTLVPISTWSKPAEIARMLSAARVSVVIARNFDAGEGIAALREACAVDPTLTAIPIYDWSGTGAATPLADLLGEAGRCHEQRWQRDSRPGLHSDADLAILYTSGSTGQPKGVMLRQTSVARNGSAIAARMGFSAADRVFSYFPFFFSGGLCNALTGAVASAAELVTQARFTPAGALKLIRARHCTGRIVWHDGLEPIAALEHFRPEDLRPLRRGLHVDPGFLARLGLPPDEGVNMYGMTETATAFTCGDYREPAAIRQSTHGTPFPGTDLRVVRPGTSSPLRDGSEGEICVRGYNLMHGYTDGSEAALIDEDGFFHTGDIGIRSEDGFLRFVGRHKTMIKVKGLTVQPEEVEATLLRHPAVAKAVVVGQDDGHESSGVAALAVLHPGAATAADVEAFCRGELSSYKVPRVLVIEADAFPLSASLKVNRVAARALANEMLQRKGVPRGL